MNLDLVARFHFDARIIRTRRAVFVKIYNKEVVLDTILYEKGFVNTFLAIKLRIWSTFATK